MKTLIVYSSSYGFTERCARRIAANLGEETTDVMRIRKLLMPDIRGYDKVIIGSPVYMGQIDTWIKLFCENKLDQLLEKEVGIFVCCGRLEQVNEVIGVSFPKQLITAAKGVEVLGGEVDLERLRPHHRFVIKAAMVTKLADIKGVKGPGFLYKNHQRLVRMLNA